MGGPIAESTVYVCPACRALWLADPAMYVEPERCPRCGRMSGEPANDNQGEGDEYGIQG